MREALTLNQRDGRPDTRSRSVVLGTCCLAVFIAGLDTTIINIALPSIQRALHASVSGLQWTIDVYTLVIACFLMLSGSLADRFGRWPAAESSSCSSACYPPDAGPTRRPSATAPAWPLR
jgi:hypothetical protein